MHETFVYEQNTILLFESQMETGLPWQLSYPRRSLAMLVGEVPAGAAVAAAAAAAIGRAGGDCKIVAHKLTLAARDRQFLFFKRRVILIFRARSVVCVSRLEQQRMLRCRSRARACTVCHSPR